MTTPNCADNSDTSATAETYILPMSPAQQRLWFLDQLDPGTTIFNIPVALRLRGSFDSAALARAWSRLTLRHEVLRTTLSSLHDAPVQTIHPHTPLELSVRELVTLAPPAREAALLRELREAAALPFELARGPLVRVSLWRLDRHEHALMISLHHAIADGWSLGVLYRELGRFYEIECGASLPAPAPLSIQYADYAQWQRERMENGELDRQRAHWERELHGYHGFLNLHTDHARPAEHTFAAAVHVFRVPDSSTDSLHGFSQEMGVTLFISTITAYALLLSRYSGQNDLCVGIPVAGRTEAELEQLIGFFVNGLAIRFQFDPHASIRSVMAQARQTVLSAFANQEISLDSVLDTLQIARHPAYEPLVQATFGLQNLPRAPDGMPGLEVLPIEIACMHSRYDLMLMLSETADGLVGHMAYNTALFEPASVTRMMRHLCAIMDAMCAAPDAPLESLGFVSQADLFELLAIAPRDYERILPLNAMQRDLYVDTLAHPDSAQNTVGYAFDIHAAVNPDLWREVVQTLTDSQSVLRTRILASPVPYTEPAYQCVLRHADASLELLDWSGRALDQAALAELVRQPFGADGALVRHLLITLGPQHHVALIINHHLLLDGLATESCMQWVCAEYSRRAGFGADPGTPIALPAPDLFHDQIEASRLVRDSAALIDWWQAALAKVTPPHCPGASAVAGRARCNRELAIPSELWAEIRRYSRQQRATPQIFLKSVFSILADAHCQCEGDLLIQEFHGGRPAGHANTLGCYYLAAPFVVPRARLAGDASFGDLIEHARAWQKSSASKAGLSLQQQSRIAPAGRTSFSFNFITIAMEASVVGQRSEGMRFTPHADGVVQFEVCMAGDSVLVTLNYEADRFAESDFLARFLQVCRQLIAQGERTPVLGQLELLLPHERAPTPALPLPLPAFVAISEQIALQAQRSPGAVAIVQGERSISYAELMDQATHMAAALAAQGAGPGQRVGICLERSPEMIIALLATLFTGAAYVPMDAAYPAARLARIIDDADCSVIVTQACLRERLAQGRASVLELDTDPWRSFGAAAPVARGAGDVFYVLYTSGSTGQPKGALVSDAGAANLANWYRSEFAIGPSDRLLIMSAFGFDLTQKNFFAALTTGAMLVLPRCMQFDPDDILKSIATQRASIVNCAPSAFHALLAEPARLAMLATLRLVFLGGEPVRVEQLETWLRHPDCQAQVVNTYGPTECTDVVAYYRLAAPFDYLGREVPIGMPVDHATLVVLDAAGRAVPPFGVGEVWIGGLCVGQGYWRDPAMTERKFQQRGAAGMQYRSGDSAYRGADGWPVFMGRRDGQVKVRGQRIELGEVEAALRETGQAREWLVLAVNDQLVAYARTDGATPALAELRARLAGRLPEGMLPTALICVTAWPLGSHGKVDRDLLARMEAPASTRNSAPPQGDTEVRLARLWSDALGKTGIERDDNFFTIGGHSLLAARIVSRIRTEFAVDLPLRALFDHTTVATLAQRIDALKEPAPASLAIAAPAGAPIVHADRTQALALSFAQRRLWFLERLYGASAAYNMPAAFRLSGALDIGCLSGALSAVVERHEVLRTRLVEQDGEPRQLVDPAAQLSLPVTDLRAISAGAREQALHAVLEQHAARPFDLAHEHPLCALLVVLGEQSFALALNLHHVASDGWSSGILLRELAQFYNAQRAGQIVPLAALPLQYADYAAWQIHAPDQQVRLASALDYWRGQLADAPAGCNLPTDFARTARPASAGGNLTFDIGAEIAAQARALARQSDTSLYQVLLAVLLTLVHRWSGDTDIIIGSPIANRPRAEFEGLIGFFVNTLPMRVSLDQDPDFRTLLAQVRAVTLDAYAHADLPFEQMVEKINPERRLNQSPFFQIMFAMQSGHANGAGADRVRLDGLQLEPLSVNTGAARLDLTLSMQDTDGALSGHLEYASALFKPETAQRFTEHFRNLLAAALRETDTPVSRLDLLSKAERHRLLIEWNRNSTERDRRICLHQLVERQGAATPHAPALLCGDAMWTYAQLLAASSRIARLLIERGIGPDNLVGVCLDRSPDLIATLLGVLRAGAAYVALDPAYPAARLHYIIGDSAAPVILTERRYREQIFAGVAGAEVIALDEVFAQPAAATAEPLPERGVGPDNLAYVLYTSGSTGQPKGVAIEHRSPAALIDWARSIWPPEELAGVLAGTSICFDLSVFEIFLPLSVGGTVILAENVLELAHIAARDKVTLVNTVPSAIDALLRQDALPASVRVVNLAGEMLSTELADRVYGVPSVRKVYDLYGPSEDTTYSTYRLRVRGEAPTIGRPIANTQLYILDPALKPAPVGVPGEIYLAGEGLARGYLGRPDLTEERFVPNPFTPGQRMYRTGDLARFFGDGNVEYLGRIDHQVKLRGFRIELGEIESVLRQYPGADHAIVVVERLGEGLQRLIGYVAHHAGAAIEPALRTHLAARVPDYMVPAALVVLDALPLTPNGKIDRKALPSVQSCGADAAQAPLSELERHLATLWEELLGVAGIGRADDFFVLGGHSLLAVRLLARIRESLHCELSLRDLFEQSRLGDQASRIARQSGSAAMQAITLQPRGGRLPLSFAQQRLWFLDQLDPGSAAYNMPGALRLTGPLDHARLRAAFARLIERHEILRMVFPEREGVAGAELAPTPAQLSVLDLRANPDALQAYLDEDARRAFDLARGPLIRAAALRISEDTTIFAATLHHIVADGWSIGLFLNELCEHYANVNDAGAPLTIQYADYAAWQRAGYQNGEMASQLEYWKANLQGAPALLTLPTDRPRPATQRHHGDAISVDIGAASGVLLEQTMRDHGVTAFMTFLAAYAVLLSRYAGQDDIVVGVPCAGRTRSEFEPLIGMFVGTLPVRLRLDQAATFADLLAQVKSRMLDALSKQDLPFEKLVDELGVARNLAYSPLFQAMFVMQSAPPKAVTPPGIAIEQYAAGSSASAKYDMTLSVTGDGGPLSAHFEYDTDLFDRSSVAAMAAQFVAILHAALADTGAALAQLRIDDPLELARVRKAAAHGAALAPPVCAPAGPLAARGDAAEKVLSEVWCNLLKRRHIDVNDNYFVLGGDSILTIVMIARLRERGWSVQPKDIFRHQSIAALAPVLKRRDQAGPRAEETSGPLALTRLQQIFIDLAPPTPNHFNQAILVRVRADISSAHLAQALDAIVRCHPALRSRFSHGVDGWRQHIEPTASAALVVHELGQTPAQQRTAELERLCEQAQGSLDILAGPVFRALLFRLDEGETPRLLLLAHHLVVDAVSWRIIMDDIETALAQLSAGLALVLTPESVGPTAWRAALAPVQRPARRDSAGHALRDLVHQQAGASRPGSVVCRLAAGYTDKLLTEVHRAYNTQVPDLILASLGQQLCRLSAREAVLVDVEGHGRNDLGETIDLGRSVGWFTSLKTARLACAAHLSLATCLPLVKEALRGAADDIEGADVSFNYLGQSGAGQMGTMIIGVAPESPGAQSAADLPRRYLLDCNASVIGDELLIVFSFDEACLPHSVVAELGGAVLTGLQELISHCLSPQAGHYTPSDFALEGLGQSDLDDLLDGLDLSGVLDQ